MDDVERRWLQNRAAVHQHDEGWTASCPCGWGPEAGVLASAHEAREAAARHLRQRHPDHPQEIV